MLVEFSVTNFKSIKETQTLSLVANSSSELREENSFTVPGLKGLRLLRSAVIYGPNASGKTNFMDAIDFMNDFVGASSKEGQEGELIEVKPFLFDLVSKKKPSEFEVIFVEQETRYQYGFAVNGKRVLHEWLIAYPEGYPQRWFEREFDDDSKSENWYFGSKFKGRKSLLKESTRENALFLSTAVQLNNEQLKPIYNWFRKKFRTIGVGGIHYTLSAEQCATSANKKRILDLLNSADISIADINIEKKPIEFPPNFPKEMKETIREQLGDEMTDVKFLHKVENSSELVPLNRNEESAGTKKLFSLAGPWLKVLENGYVLFVDELNKSMHPKMVRFLIGLINNSRSNKINAQLIFSTHDTTILDNDILRRDQIWFMEKDSSNATNLYPLTDFTPRKGEALGKGYLSGRYGALPFIGEMKF